MLKWLLSLFFKKTENKIGQIVEEKIPEIQMKNDSKRLHDEWENLQSENNDLWEIGEDINTFTYKNFKKTVVITMILRTQKEQDEIYNNDPKYQQKPFKSPHQFAQALDIRSKIFAEDEIKKIESYVNEKYNSTNYFGWSAKCHTVGSGAEHFHVQYYKKD
jgi:hypothetical protein